MMLKKHRSINDQFALFIAEKGAKISASGQTCGQVRKWACSTLKAGRNKSILYIAKTRDFTRICEKIKEKRVFITKLLKILCFTAFKTYSNRALPIKNR